MGIKIKSALLTGMIGFFLVCCLAACSPWKKMTSWLLFGADKETRYTLTNKEIEKFARTIKTTGSNSESHYRLACFYQENKKHRLAIQEFKKALQNDPDYVKAYNGLGVSYDLSGEFAGAVQAYEAALRLDPNLAYVHNNLGYSYLLQEKFEPAVNSFQKAVALDKENRQYHNNLALAYGKQGKYDLAFNEFKRADNEEKARRYMAQLFNQKPGMYSAEILVAENLPQNDNQDAGQEKPAQLALLDEDVREETLTPSPLKNLAPRNNEPLLGTQRVVISQNIDIANRSSDSTENTKTSSDDHPDIQIFPNALNGIEIAYGKGMSIRHVARSVGSTLTKKGFHVASLKDEPGFTVKKTTIYYCEGYLQEAYQVARQIPQYQDMVKVKQFENQNIKIRVVLGRDMFPYYKRPPVNEAPLRSL